MSQSHLDMLQAEGVELFSNFSFVGGWGKFGSWGILEFMDQALEDAPKYAAVTDWTAVNVRGASIFLIKEINLLSGGDLELKWRSEPAASYTIRSTGDFSIWGVETSAIASQGMETITILPGAGGTPPKYFVVEEE
ncbi:MAG: hypothetical protein ACC661_10140 [Verrucomicrobiales bacterium]